MIENIIQFYIWNTGRYITAHIKLPD